MPFVEFSPRICGLGPSRVQGDPVEGLGFLESVKGWDTDYKR